MTAFSMVRVFSGQTFTHALQPIQLEWLKSSLYLPLRARARELVGQAFSARAARPDKAPFYAWMAFITLAEIVRDYRRHKLLRSVFEKIAPEVEIKAEELLRAYPDDRSVVRVQFIRDNMVRVTVRRNYVFEAEEVDGGLKVE